MPRRTGKTKPKIDNTDDSIFWEEEVDPDESEVIAVIYHGQEGGVDLCRHVWSSSFLGNSRLNNGALNNIYCLQLLGPLEQMDNDNIDNWIWMCKMTRTQMAPARATNPKARISHATILLKFDYIVAHHLNDLARFLWLTERRGKNQISLKNIPVAPIGTFNYDLIRQGCIYFPYKSPETNEPPLVETLPIPQRRSGRRSSVMPPPADPPSIHSSVDPPIRTADRPPRHSSAKPRVRYSSVLPSRPKSQLPNRRSMIARPESVGTDTGTRAIQNEPNLSNELDLNSGSIAVASGVVDRRVMNANVAPPSLPRSAQSGNTGINSGENGPIVLTATENVGPPRNVRFKNVASSNPRPSKINIASGTGPLDPEIENH